MGRVPMRGGILRITTRIRVEHESQQAPWLLIQASINI